MVVAKFDAASTLTGKNLTSALLKFDVTAGSYNSALRVFVIPTTWDATTAKWGNVDLSNARANVVTDGTDYSEKNKTKSFSYEIKSFLNEDDDKVIGFVIGTTTTRTQTLLNLKLVLTYEDASSTAEYTVNFIDQATTAVVKTESRVGTIGSNPVLEDSDDDSFKVDGKKYEYVSDNASSVTIAGDGTSVLAITVKEASKWDWAINAVDADDNVITIANNGQEYVGENKTAYYPAVVFKNGTYYVCGTKTSSPYYAKNLTQDNPTVSVTYSADATISYYVEGENLSVVSRRDGGASTDRLSAGGGVRVAPYGYAYTESMDAGTYTIILNMNNSNSGLATLKAELFDGGDNFIDTGKTFEYAQNSTPGEVTITNVVIPEGYNFALVNDSKYNSNASIDYLIFKRTGDATVPATIGADGYATFSSAYALDFTDTGIDAYIAKTSETAGVVDMQKVTKAPANTGLFLKGATANVPVTTAATDDVTGNLLVPTTGADIPQGAYVLAKQDDNVAFYRLTSALSGVAAGKAYLSIPSSAKSFALNFGDATGIESLRQATKEGEGQWFNLAGQRVAQPTKGLYIVNGKKVSVK